MIFFTSYSGNTKNERSSCRGVFCWNCDDSNPQVFGDFQSITLTSENTTGLGHVKNVPINFPNFWRGGLLVFRKNV